MILSVWESPAVVGLGAAVVAAIPAYLAFRSTREKDAATKQTATETGHTAHVAQIIDGLESVIKALQEDNRVLRGDRDLEREINRLRIAKEVVSEAKGRIAEIENGQP